jgi:hypothetical protein
MLPAADLHAVGLQEELLFRRTRRHKPQNVSALGHLFHLPGGDHMRMLDDLDAVTNLEGLPVGYYGGMGVAVR